MSVFTDMEIDMATKDGKGAYARGVNGESCHFTFPELKEAWLNGWKQGQMECRAAALRRRNGVRAIEHEQTLAKVATAFDFLYKGESLALHTIADSLYPLAVRTGKTGEYNSASGVAARLLGQVSSITKVDGRYLLRADVG